MQSVRAARFDIARTRGPHAGDAAVRYPGFLLYACAPLTEYKFLSNTGPDFFFNLWISTVNDGAESESSCGGPVMQERRRLDPFFLEEECARVSGKRFVGSYG